MPDRLPILAACLMLALAGAAIAAPPENADPALAPWYESLTQPETGLGCCSIADCREVESRLVGDHYEALIRDRWMIVPPERILEHTPNPTGRAVACWRPRQGIRCFVRATET